MYFFTHLIDDFSRQDEKPSDKKETETRMFILLKRELWSYFFYPLMNEENHHLTHWKYRELKHSDKWFDSHATMYSEDTSNLQHTYSLHIHSSFAVCYSVSPHVQHPYKHIRLGTFRALTHFLSETRLDFVFGTVNLASYILCKWATCRTLVCYVTHRKWKGSWESRVSWWEMVENDSRTVKAEPINHSLRNFKGKPQHVQPNIRALLLKSVLVLK